MTQPGQTIDKILSTFPAAECINAAIKAQWPERKNDEVDAAGAMLRLSEELRFFIQILVERCGTEAVKPGHIGELIEGALDGGALQGTALQEIYDKDPELSKKRIGENAEGIYWIDQIAREEFDCPLHEYLEAKLINITIGGREDKIKEVREAANAIALVKNAALAKRNDGVMSAEVFTCINEILETTSMATVIMMQKNMFGNPNGFLLPLNKTLAQEARLATEEHTDVEFDVSALMNTLRARLIPQFRARFGPILMYHRDEIQRAHRETGTIGAEDCLKDEDQVLGALFDNLTSDQAEILRKSFNDDSTPKS